MKLELALIVLCMMSTLVFAQECSDFTQKLETCTPYECKFKHPFTGEMMKRQISGIVSDRCKYSEEMPNGGKMECKYPLNKIKEIAQYYQKLLSADQIEAKVSWKSISGEMTTQTKVDGEELKSDPLQECLTDGDCVISGYGKP